MAFEILWGLCFHRPMLEFCNDYIPRTQRIPDVYSATIGGNKNKNRARVESRISLLLSLVKFLSKDVDEDLLNGLFMLDRLYNFAFGFQNGELLKGNKVNVILEVFQRSEFAPQCEAIKKLAAAYGSMFNLDEMLKMRGTNAISEITELALPVSSKRQNNGGQPSGSAKTTKTKKVRRMKDYSCDQILEYQITAAEELQIQGLSSFGQQLFRYLYHILHAGFTMLRLQHEIGRGKATNDNATIASITSDHTRKMVRDACNSDLNGDKLMPFHASGPSFTAFVQTYQPMKAGTIVHHGEQ